jgi:hypothetical protein
MILTFYLVQTGIISFKDEISASLNLTAWIFFAAASMKHRWPGAADDGITIKNKGFLAIPRL